jgi:hypothetical protein
MVKAFQLRVNNLIQRAAVAAGLGLTFDGQRDLYASFGWPRQVSLINIFNMYFRGGIAQRVVHAYPDSTWGRPPRLYLPENEEFNQRFARIAWDLDLWDVFRRADILAGLGRYSIILIGTNRGRMEAPIPRGGAGALQITYLQPYGENNVRISAWDTDPQSPRFGLPERYTIGPVDGFNQANAPMPSAPSTTPQRRSFDVHHSRVIHISHGGLEGKTYGLPRFIPVWNYLEDLIKVVGSSSESYWRTAYQGLHADVDSDMDLDEEDEANLTAEMDEYQHNLRRIIRTRGVKVQSLGSTVADPRGAFDVLVTLISGTTGVPKRILLGSEAGQLASSQDKANWAERVEEYRELHAEPNIIWPFVTWCMDNGLVPRITEGLERMRSLWPDAYRMSPLERGQQAAQTARSLANIMKGMEGPVESPGTPDVTDPTTGQVTPGTPEVRGQPLITREEARRIIGLSSDQQVLIESPEEGQ